MIRGVLLGVVLTLVVMFGFGAAAVQLGYVPSRADAKAGKIEQTIAMTALHRSIRRTSNGVQSPLQTTDENLLAGVKLYGANCAVCHGASDAKPSKLAQGFYIESPMLAKDGVEEDDLSESYWKIKHGIRFTAMPAFVETLSEDQLWQLALFVKAMDKLPPVVDAQWKALPSQTRE